MGREASNLQKFKKHKKTCFVLLPLTDATKTQIFHDFLHKNMTVDASRPT